MRKSQRLPLEALEPYLLPTPPRGPWATAPTEQLNFAQVFGNSNPVELEVGFGKGLFLVTTGQANPNVNYLGIEIVRKYQLFAAIRLALRELRNVRVACTDAREFIRDAFPDACVRTVHVYFPDPWWKSRHHKRRVFTPEFALQCQRILAPDGQLLVVTDVADYAQMVRETVAGHTRFVEGEPPQEHTPGHDMDYLTNFERKFRQEGRSIHRMRFVQAH